jgi:hypothetical protein
MFYEQSRTEQNVAMCFYFYFVSNKVGLWAAKKKLEETFSEQFSRRREFFTFLKILHL